MRLKNAIDKLLDGRSNSGGYLNGKENMKTNHECYDSLEL